VIKFSEFDADKGRALSVEWLPPNSESLMIGFSCGIIGFFKAENKAQKPFKTIDLKNQNLISMHLGIV
jgi:hypothetical protein